LKKIKNKYILALNKVRDELRLRDRKKRREGSHNSSSIKLPELSIKST